MSAPSSPPAASGRSGAAVPAILILIAGSAVALLTFGPRSVFGLFLLPMSQEFGWGRDVFGFAVAIQNLLWGVGSPFAGALADRFGTVRVLCCGALIYAAGLALMAYATTPGLLHLSAGVLIGFGLSAASFNLVLAAFGKLLPNEWKSIGFGLATAAGSFGQFLFPPLTRGLMDTIGWHETLLVFGASLLIVLPFSLALSTRAAAPSAASAAQAPQQTIGAALSEALRHPSYVLLVLGFFTCGFQLAFVTVHMPAFLVDKGMSLSVGAYTLALIGLFNILGSLTAGYLSNRMSRKVLLSVIYAGRGIAIAVFVMSPITATSCYVFGAAMGFLWLSTVPPTSGLVMLMFGTRYMAMLYGFAFFSHQVGGFLGVYLGGEIYEATKSYDWLWWLSVALSFASAAINLPIRERPVHRPVTV
ncbi:MFS family permease [Xanthobacter flavus]|uniref:MFS family permease n=1 Tax=Xanthobacter flavus TaxID=281 RepID=A0A9W6FLY8_XANFL|nr:MULTISPECIES: MFS transporter [Xanthobacter]MDR6336376.1 MFS family permease [Xanthobacter flavus]NMN59979.1 MFS family permease [Xanthobacter sp. SG618]GLI25349.1 MFS transporter [Xanthobacter flavus]